jgi:hypothetical protein
MNITAPRVITILDFPIESRDFQILRVMIGGVAISTRPGDESPRTDPEAET